MKYRIELETHAKREFSKLPKQVQEGIAEVIDDLSNHARPPGCKKLSQQEGYRIRKGDYRILYMIDDSQHLIRIYRIGHRREIYR